MKSLTSILEHITKIQHAINGKYPFDENRLMQLQKYYKAEMTWTSNALEGNTLTLEETKMILESGITVRGHTSHEIYECTGHAEAYDYMFDHIRKKEITEEYIKKLHYLFAKNITDIPCPGEYRDVSKTFVGITGSEYPCPDYEKVPEKMAEFADWASSIRNELHPVEFAAEAHRTFIYIHPFPDGNGRIARLLMNTILLQEQYMPVLIHPIQRNEYIHTLENGRIYPNGFDIFIAKRELEQQKRFMKLQ